MISHIQYGKGYTYYIFKYNNGRYLGLFDFHGIDNILIEFKDIIEEYND